VLFQTIVAGARHFSELVSWQLADALRIETFKLTRRPPFARDFKHQAQTEDAIDSVCRNIAEGFGCESHAEFARFLEISRRSLNELVDCLRSAQLKGYLAANDAEQVYSLARRLYPALSRFLAYLRRTPRPRHRTRSDPRSGGSS
jgi:four helix bundle protein